MRHLHAALLCGVFRVSVYDVKDVYWEIPDNLPKMTKLMIDGKALYIHRANFQIIDSDCLTEE